MNFFKLKSWWHYRRNALSRHSIHSPFVYRFVEEALRSSLPATVLQAFCQAKGANYGADTLELLARSTHFLNQENAPNEADYLILTGEPEVLLQAAQEHLPRLRDGLCLFLTGIHESSGHAAVWKALAADERVNLSLELWQLGMLFFRSDFLEKQHFTLRYRA